MADHIAIPRGEFQELLRAVRRGIEVCAEVSKARLALRVSGVNDRGVEQAVRACEDVGRLRVDLVALERKLLEVDQELTPVRPPSQQDIKAAFANSVDFAQGKVKPG